MKTISSKDNPTYKEACRLLRKKYRDQTGMFLIEGPKPIMDAAESGADLGTVFVKQSVSESRQAEDVVNTCEKGGCRAVILADGLFDRLSDTENSQGIAATAVKRESEMPSEGPVVILDRLGDPGNIGTIIRTAEAAGFRAVISIKGTGDIYSPKTVRAAAGSLLRVSVFEGIEASEAIAICREQDRSLVVSDLEGSVIYTEAELGGRIALVIGNEGSGISEELRSAADIRVRIPMEGNIESLNAAVAAGILMYESARQAKAAGKV